MGLSWTLNSPNVVIHIQHAWSQCNNTYIPVYVLNLRSRLQWGSMQTIYIFLTRMSTCRNRMLTSFWGTPETKGGYKYTCVLNSNIPHLFISRNETNALIALPHFWCFIICKRNQISYTHVMPSLAVRMVLSLCEIHGFPEHVLREKVRFSRRRQRCEKRHDQGGSWRSTMNTNKCMYVHTVRV